MKKTRKKGMFLNAFPLPKPRHVDSVIFPAKLLLCWELIKQARENLNIYFTFVLYTLYLSEKLEIVLWIERLPF